MSKRKKSLDTDQLNLFDQQIDQYIGLKKEILTPKIHQIAKNVSSREETCMELALAIKKAIKKSSLSREQVVDGINEYFGLKGKCKLSIHMLNHYIAKPDQYPIPGYLIFGIQHVCKSLAPCTVFAEAENAKVINQDEVRQMTLGKIDENILELQKLKRELRNGR